MNRSLDEFLPSWDVQSSHSMVVAASDDRVYAAIRDHNLAASPIVKALFLVRGLPVDHIGIDRLLAAGFVMLEQRPPEALILGVTGQFWRPTGRLLPIGPAEFRGFDDPGQCQAVWAFSVEAQTDGSLLSTETRVRCTDDHARRRFGLYWRVVGPFSGIIRRASLRTIKDLAENG